MSCHTMGLDENHPDTKRLRQKLLEAIEKSEPSASWQYTKDVSTQDMLVQELSRRTHLTPAQFSNVPVKKLVNVFSRTASVEQESMAHNLTRKEIFAPTLCLLAMAGSVYFNQKAMAVVFGFFSMIGVFNVMGLRKDVIEARDRNQAAANDLLLTQERQTRAIAEAQPACGGPCRTCSL